MINHEANRDTWNKHYLRDKSRLGIPDENIVRFINHYIRNHPENRNPYILEIGSGSGRNLEYLRTFSSQVFGMDFAQNGLIGQKKVVCAASHENPFKENTFDIVIAWGILHYLSLNHIEKTLNEVKKILKPKGIFLGTIRSNKDTHLKNVLDKGDLKNGNAELYSESEVFNLFNSFKQTQLGFIMRQQPGDPGIIAHHIFEATP